MLISTCSATLSITSTADSAISSPMDARIPSPTPVLQRVIPAQRVGIMFRTNEVTGPADIVGRDLCRRESHGRVFLQEQDVTATTPVNYISHGIAERGLTESTLSTARGGSSNNVPDPEETTRARRRRAARSTPVAST